MTHTQTRVDPARTWIWTHTQAKVVARTWIWTHTQARVVQ